MTNKKHFVYTLLAQVMVFAANIIINFFLTPYILDKLGTEAYGFIGLINNFINYISILTVALNSLAGKYITLAYHKGEKEEANEYYCSVFFANIVLSIIVLIATIVLDANIATILNVPGNLLNDVKITLYLSVTSTIITLLSVVFNVAAFIKNKMYLNSLTQMLAAVVKVGLIVSLYLIFEPHMWY